MAYPTCRLGFHPLALDHDGFDTLNSHQVAYFVAGRNTR